MDKLKPITYKFNYYHGEDKLDSLRIILPLTLIDPAIKTRVGIMAKIDTGASDVALNAHKIGIDMSEEEYVKMYNPIKDSMVGIARDREVTYYRHIVKYFMLGPFLLIDFPIKITFDDNARVMLLGMSLLRFFNITIRPEYKTIELSETEELMNYTHSNKSMRNSENEAYETYIDFGDMQAIEANYINRLINSDID